MPSEYIKKIRTTNGDKQIDYESLANLPKINNTELKGNVDVVEINQGSSNAGKVLGIGSDGMVLPVDPQDNHKLTVNNHIISLESGGGSL